MRRLGTRHASLGREDAECRDGANGWFSLGCSAESCRRTSGAGINYWGGSIRRKNNLAPQVGLEPTTLRLTAECSTIELLRSKCSDNFIINQSDATGVKPLGSAGKALA